MSVSLLTRGIISSGARRVIVDTCIESQGTFEDPETVLTEYEQSAITPDQSADETISTEEISPTVVIEDDDVIIRSGC